MSKKIIPILVIATFILSAVLLALPQGALAAPQLGITPTPTPTEPPPTEPPPTDPPPTEPPPTEPPPTEPPPTEPPPTEPPPTESPATEAPSKPKETEVVLLPATGEFPIDSSQGMQLFFALVLILSIGFVLIRTVRGEKIKK